MKTLLANIVMIALSLVVCCVLYPLGLWAFAQVVFSNKADGSLLTVKDKDGKERIIGSRRIAQQFTSDEYFWPRPSAAGYNGAAAGGSNWGANNPKLRDRVAQFLGPIILYKKASVSAGTDPDPRTPQQDIEAWFAAKPDRAADWANEYSVAATNWAKTDLAKDKYGLQGEFILSWAKDHADVIGEWKKANPTKTDEPKPEELVGIFFTNYAKAHPAKWPGVVEVEQQDKSKVKEIQPVSSDSAIVANFFDMWLQDPANRSKVADLEPVPADMVTASGSGLDPDITLRNALSVYQLDRVAKKRTPEGGDWTKSRKDIEEMLKRNAFSSPFGEPLVNVLEVNSELDTQFPVPPAP